MWTTHPMRCEESRDESGWVSGPGQSKYNTKTHRISDGYTYGLEPATYRLEVCRAAFAPIGPGPFAEQKA